MPSIFRCHGQEWILPVLPRENILKIRPPLFISYFFAIESNKREPASSSNKHFLTEAYKTVLERTLGLHPGDVEMHRTLQRWKEDKYWTFAHGGAGDAYSTRAIHGVGTSTTDPNSRLKGSTSSYKGTLGATSEKQQECFFWRRDGFCKRQYDGSCQFFHPETWKQKDAADPKDKSMSYSHYSKVPAQSGKSMECYYWSQGICKHSAKDCKYAHHQIEGGSNRPGPFVKREKVHETDKVDPADSGNDSSSKLLECYYWRKNGVCKLSDKDCLYAHHPTGKVKVVHGLPKIGDLDSYPLEARITVDPSRPQGDQHLETSFRDYALPQPPSTSLTKLTLAAFYDRFCYTNPTARKDPPWETVLSMFKAYVVRHFGKDSLEHVLAAYTRTELPIPSDILERQTIKTDDEFELYKKEEALVRAPPHMDTKSECNAQIMSSKRGRSTEEVDPTTPKRAKYELITPKVLSPETQNSPRAAECKTKSDQVALFPVELRSRLYSPSMPNLATLPTSNGRSPSAMSDRLAELERENILHVSKQPSQSSNGQLPESASLVHLPIAKPEFQTMVQNGSKVLTPQALVKAVDCSGSNKPVQAILGVRSKSRTLSPPISRQHIPSSVLTQSAPTLEKSNRKRLSPNDTTVKGCEKHIPSKISMKTSSTGVSVIRRSLQNGYAPTLPSPDTEMDDPTSSSGEPALVTPQLSQAESAHLQEHGAVRNGPFQDSSSTVRDTPCAMVKYPNQEPILEPIGAHIVRLEALLRGALTELVASTPRDTSRPRVDFSYQGTAQESVQKPLGARMVCVEALVTGALGELSTLKRRIG